jgi:hypothetical protein
MHVVEGKEPFICCNCLVEKIWLGEIDFPGNEGKMYVCVIGICSYFVWKVDRVFSEVPSAQLYIPT